MMFNTLLKKTIFIIGCLVGAGLLFLVFSYLYMEAQFFFVVRDKIEHLPEKYQTYADNCITPLPTRSLKDRQTCCLESLEAMARGGYSIAPRAFSDDPTRGCGYIYAKLRCDGSLEWCDEMSSQYPILESETNIDDYEGKDQVLDEAILIKVPSINQIGSIQYGFQKESDQHGLRLDIPNGDTSVAKTLPYLTSLVATGEETKGSEHVFLIYKTKIDFGNESLTDWLKRLYDLNLPDEFRDQSGKGDTVAIETWKTDMGEDVAFFHMPVPSDNGWYAYRNEDVLYLFSMGNNSYAVHGHRSGLWDAMMRSLRVAKPVTNFSLTPTSEWQHFQDAQFGVEFAYPADWQVLKQNDGTIVLNSPHNQQALKDIQSGKMYGEGYMSTITVKRFKSVAHEDENMGIGAKTVTEMINRNLLVSNPERVLLQGKEYWAATRGGFGAYYTVFVDGKKAYFEIMFGYKENNNSLDSVERSIVSSMKFH